MIRDAVLTREAHERVRAHRDVVHLPCTDTSVSHITQHTAVHEPNSAMSSDVLPHPVGPTMRLMRPDLNATSSSTRSLKARLSGRGDAVPSLLFHVNELARIPTYSRASGAKAWTSPEGPSVNVSRSSVWICNCQISV